MYRKEGIYWLHNPSWASKKWGGGVLDKPETRRVDPSEDKNKPANTHRICNQWYDFYCGTEDNGDQGWGGFPCEVLIKYKGICKQKSKEYNCIAASKEVLPYSQNYELQASLDLFLQAQV